MTQRERQILNWIEADPMISQQELAERAGITRSSVAVHISNLMKKGCIAGKGYIVTPRRVFNITEVSVFVPDFDKESVTFHCAADAKETMEIVHFVTELNDYDKTCLVESRMVLPRFRTISQGWTYDEDFKDNSVTTSMMLLEHRNLGRLSMGCVKGNGPIEIGQHIHNELAQWYFPLPGSDFIYTAGGEEVHMTGGDLSYTPTGFWHGSRVEAGKKCDYIWFEMCIEGYPGEIK